MGAPVRSQKAVSRTKEKRRGGAPIGAPARVMGRPFPSAEGTGFAARRATGCGDPHQRLSALRLPRMGANPPRRPGARSPGTMEFGVVTAEDRNGAEYFGGTNPRKEQRRFGETNPRSSAPDSMP